MKSQNFVTYPRLPRWLGSNPDSVYVIHDTHRCAARFSPVILENESNSGSTANSVDNQQADLATISLDENGESPIPQRHHAVPVLFATVHGLHVMEPGYMFELKNMMQSYVGLLKFSYSPAKRLIYESPFQDRKIVFQNFFAKTSVETMTNVPYLKLCRLQMKSVNRIFASIKASLRFLWQSETHGRSTISKYRRGNWMVRQSFNRRCHCSLRGNFSLVVTNPNLPCLQRGGAGPGCPPVGGSAR